MPTAMLTFQLPEEQEEFADASKAMYYRGALGDLWNKLRSKLKYEDLTDEQQKCYEQVRQWLADACDDYDLEVP